MKINDVLFNVELEDILIELKSQLSANGIELFQKQINGPTHIQVCCPYHADGHERRPSAGLRKSDGIFHCFACGEVHSLQEVISHCFGYTDDIVGRFGWRWLLKNFATIEVEERKDVELDFYRSGTTFDTSHGRAGRKELSKDNNVDVELPIQYVSEEELNKYRYIHPYMYKRGLTDAVINLFDIGYDFNTKCLTFPVRDIQGNCLFIARRSVISKYFNYPNGVEKPLYGLHELYKDWREINAIYKEADKDWFDNVADYDDVIVTESMLDALSFWTIGKHAVALNGLGNELQFKQLRELPCREIILATDMDEKGLEARERIKKNLHSKIVMQYRFPKGRKDANECTKEELMNLKEVF